MTPLARILPFTTSLRNLGFLAKIALLARLGVAVIRTVMNAPFLNPSKEMTSNQKHASFIERATIEVLGTAIYATGMYLSMDGVGALFERFSLKPQFEAIQKTIDALEASEGNTRLGKIFNRTFSGAQSGKVGNLIHKYILGDDFKGRYGGNKAGYWAFKDLVKAASIPEETLKAIEKQVVKLSGSLNRASMYTQFAGIAAACVLGGPILQSFNDKVVRPFALHLAGTDSIKPVTHLERIAQSPLLVKPLPVQSEPGRSPSVVVIPKKPAKAYRPGFVPFDPVTPPLEQMFPSRPSISQAFSVHQSPAPVVRPTPFAPVFQSMRAVSAQLPTNLQYGCGGVQWLQ